MFVVKDSFLQSKSKRRKTSSSSSSCFDDFVKRLQQLNHHAARFKDHLTTELVRVFEKDKTRNRVTCLNEQNKKKLHLVLDLDHTLIHSVLVSDLSKHEKYIFEEVDTMQDLWRCNTDNTYEFIIKLRPLVHEFLLEANKLFTMHVYTMANSSYAKTVLKLIDPDKVYFGDRVITRDTSPYNKTLRLVRADKRRVIVVDDMIDVWPHHKRNVLQINKYVYFREGDDTMRESYAEKKRDESRHEGALVNVLKFLEDVHKRFVDSEVLVKKSILI